MAMKHALDWACTVSVFMSSVHKKTKRQSTTSSLDFCVQEKIHLKLFPQTIEGTIYH